MRITIRSNIPDGSRPNNDSQRCSGVQQGAGGKYVTVGQKKERKRRGESVTKQHRVLVDKMSLEVKRRKEVRAEPRIRWWKINEEYSRKFGEEVNQVLGDRVEEDRWEVISASREGDSKEGVLGVTIGRRKEDNEIWWWNEEVQDSISRKKWDRQMDKESKQQEYKEMWSAAKKEVAKTTRKTYENKSVREVG
ncbi:hypothetical protein Pmani_004467 [Petrolisthes manimaculis]|uniref:Uncharacterized protein n=1 Tax=Petrolisthes manimaculis TaxID=1843537 RepID=A0AAE1UIH8_9EUCA|nr:hypothetical protein Pmani_004467 [Petrolisthes manimaculis]